MNYHNILHDNMINGEGLRVVLFVSGCTNRCPGCHNPETWDKDSGILFDEDAKQEIFDQLDKDYISGLTLTGGDPMAYYNRQEVTELCKEIKEKYPNKNIWLYTGYEIEEIQDEEILDYIDVIICGRFHIKEKDFFYKWAGSTNQRIIRRKDFYGTTRI